MQRLALLALTLFFAAQAFSQVSFKFAPINVPGATATQARGINGSGEVVGFYQTTACSNYTLQVPSCPTKGYELVNGQFIRLEIPNAISTTMTAVNDYGDIVGFIKKATRAITVFCGSIKMSSRRLIIPARRLQPCRWAWTARSKLSAAFGQSPLLTALFRRAAGFG